MSWELFARREHAPLSARLLQEAQRQPFFARATGIAAGLDNHAWLRDRIYIPVAELDRMESAVAARVPANDWSFLEQFTLRCGSALTGLEKTAAEIASDKRLSGGSSVPVEQAFRRWANSYREAMAFVPVFRTIDRVLSSYLSEDERARLMRADSGRSTEEAQERAALARISRRLAEGEGPTDGEEIAAMVNAHVQRYGWLGVRWHLGKPFTAEDVGRRAAALALASGLGAPFGGSLPAGEAEDDSRQRLIGELAYLRSHRAEAVSRAIWIATPLFEAMARHLDVETADVPFFLPDELLGALAGGTIAREVAASRRTAFATVLVDGVFTSAAGAKEVDEVRVRLVLPAGSGEDGDRRDGDAPLLRGVVASPGWAQGRVRLVRGGDDSRVGEGDILVTTMTYPSLVASMQRSAAIVTDDGGLLSHAAVIARELEKPCLIGTGRATEVLSEGDLVEVDCEVGVVNCAGEGAGIEPSERRRS